MKYLIGFFAGIGASILYVHLIGGQWMLNLIVLHLIDVISKL